MVFKALPWLYYITLSYDLSRGARPSAIALAAISHALQDKMGACEAFPRGFGEADSHKMRDTVIEGLFEVLNEGPQDEQIVA